MVRESWKQNQLIHPSTTNAEIDEMLSAPGVTENYQAMKLLGAGGGIRRVPQRRAAGDVGSDGAGTTAPRASGVRVVELSLNRPGLQVTVS